MPEYQRFANQTLFNFRDDFLLHEENSAIYLCNKVKVLFNNEHKNFPFLIYEQRVYVWINQPNFHREIMKWRTKKIDSN